MSQRYSPLDQITPQNVKNLELKWVFQARSLEKFEATPLVVDGIMYTVQAPNDVVALDAVTGRVFWIYSYAPSPCRARAAAASIAAWRFWRHAVHGHHRRAPDRDRRQEREAAVEHHGGQSRGRLCAHARAAGVKDKVIVGVAGGEYGIRGFIAAYDAKTGKEAWRFYTIPGPASRATKPGPAIPGRPAALRCG